MIFSYVNPKIEVSDAGRKGKGLFAKKFIQKDEIAVVFQGKIIEADSLNEFSRDEIITDHCFQIEKGLWLCPAGQNIEGPDSAFLFNHSCEPNCGANGSITFVAIRDIKSQEEITFDYAMTDNLVNFAMECLCGLPNCRKTITGDDWRRRDLQEKYKGYFSPYLQEMIDELNTSAKPPSSENKYGNKQNS